MVRMDPIPDKEGLIVLLHGTRVRTGEVLAVGPGRHTKRGAIIPLDVQVGERIAFYREHFEHQQGKMIAHRLAELGDDLGLLKETDVLFVLPSDWKGTLS